MAKVMNPLGSSEARGSVGGYVYNTWRGIATVRTRVAPAYTPGGLRDTICGYTLNASRRWSDITDAQRQQWRDWALQHVEVNWTNNPLRLPAYNWYVRINVRRQLLALGYLDIPPDHTSIAQMLELDFYFFEDLPVLTWTPEGWVGEGEYYAEIWMAGPFTAGRQAKKEDAKRMDAPDYTTGSWFSDAVLPGVYTLFLRPITDQGMIGTFVSITATNPAALLTPAQAAAASAITHTPVPAPP